MKNDSTGSLGTAAYRERQRFQTEYATDIIYTTDEQGRFVHFNPHAHTILGYSRAELLGRHYLDLVWPSYRKSTRHFYHRQYIKQIPDTYREIACMAKDGSQVWLGQNVQFLYDNGIPLGFQAVARDVTARVHNEQMSTQQTALLELIARNAPLETVLDTVCRAFETLAPGFRASVLAEGEALPADACWSTTILSPQGSASGAFALSHPSSRTPSSHELALIGRFCDLAGIAIDRARSERALHQLREDLERRVADRTRELEQANIRLQREISERQRTEQQLLQAQKLESVARLASGVAHEFNNWLTVIMLYTEELSEQLLTHPSAIGSVEEIRRAAERAASLTRQLLAFGRRQVLQPKPVDLNSLISNFSNVLRSITGSTIRLHIQPESKSSVVRADAAQIEQVLVNLALNARDAMPSGGSFTLRTADVSVGAASGLTAAAGVPPGHYVLIEAADTGIGMDPKTRERVFEPFFTTKKTGQGTGLGLATVYGVIQQSGGQILVSSTPNHGTKFQIFLPRTNMTPATATATSPAAIWGKQRVVVADDDAVIRRLIVQSLRRVGLDVLEAPDGNAALEALENNQPVSLLITDIVMPGLSGFDLASAAQQRYPGLSVLFVSAHPTSAFDEGAAPEFYLPKPFSTQELTRAVGEILAEKRD